VTPPTCGGARVRGGPCDAPAPAPGQRCGVCGRATDPGPLPTSAVIDAAKPLRAGGADVEAWRQIAARGEDGDAWRVAARAPTIAAALLSACDAVVAARADAAEARAEAARVSARLEAVSAELRAFREAARGRL
jgi:hypothetical protein